MKRSTFAFVLAGALSLFFAAPARAHIAHPGFSGLISTPTPEVLSEGTLVFAFSWMNGPQTYLRSPMTNRLYSATAGLLPGLEITLRLTEMVGWHDPTVPGVTYGNDRMVSAKYLLPLQDAWPDVAIGLQDIASANLLAGNVGSDPRLAYGQAMLYGVIGDAFGPGSWHLGISRSAAFVSGPFGGIKLQLNPGLHLMAEYDSRQVNWGVCFTPMPPLHLQLSNLGGNTWGLSSALMVRL